MDFTNCEINKLKIYGGANGGKLNIKYNNNNYMLKFPAVAKKNNNLSYDNSSISEYIGCQIFQSLEILTQDTLLGKYKINNNEKIVVACKDLEEDDFILKDFAFLKNSVVTSLSNGYQTELNEILETIDSQMLIDVSLLKTYFWDMFIVDAFLGNFDRHNGNWGFLINYKTNIVKISPIYDCGSCLYPQIDESLMSYVLDNEEEKLNRVYEFPTSAIKLNGNKINYVKFLKNNDYKECNDSFLKIKSRIDLDKIGKIIDDTPYISDIQKRFYKEMLKLRKEIIFD